MRSAVAVAVVFAAALSASPAWAGQDQIPSCRRLWSDVSPAPEAGTQFGAAFSEVAVDVCDHWMIGHKLVKVTKRFFSEYAQAGARPCGPSDEGAERTGCGLMKELPIGAPRTESFEIDASAGVNGGPVSAPAPVQ